jgi:TPR repeat protein
MERISEDKQRVVRKTHLLADLKFDEKDYGSALMLYESVLEHDLSGFSLYRLGLMLQNGLGVPADLERAEVYFSRAWNTLNSTDNQTVGLLSYNNLEDPCVRFALGSMCELGLHKFADPKDAEQHYLFAANKGHAGAQYNLACLYYTGFSVKGKTIVHVNKSKAASFFKQAAEQGNTEAQVLLGYMHYMGEGGVHPDKSEALRLFRLAAEKGSAMGQYRLGNLYYYGKGVPEDRKEALRLFQLSAAQGNPKAQNELAWLYEQGEIIPKDLSAAVNLYKAAADQGCVEAIYNLAVLTKEGMGGLTQDLAEAERLFDLAASKGHVRARSQSLQVSKKRIQSMRSSRDSLSSSGVKA